MPKEAIVLARQPGGFGGLCSDISRGGIIIGKGFSDCAGIQCGEVFELVLGFNCEPNLSRV